MGILICFGAAAQKKTAQKTPTVQAKPADAKITTTLYRPKHDTVQIAARPTGNNWQLITATPGNGHVLARRCDTCISWIVEDGPGLADYLEYRENVANLEIEMERAVAFASWECVKDFPLRIDSARLQHLKQKLEARDSFLKRVNGLK